MRSLESAFLDPGTRLRDLLLMLDDRGLDQPATVRREAVRDEIQDRRSEPARPGSV